MKNIILSQIIKKSKRREITTSLVELSEKIDRDESDRIKLWLLETLNNIPPDERRSIVKDRVYKKNTRPDYGIYKIKSACCR